MGCCDCVKSPGYRWVILVSACFVQMLRAGFISGTLSLFAIYYNERYDNRQLSSNIGSVQLSVANLVALPAVLLTKKIGERWSQIIGSILTAAGMAGTAFTSQAWQGILTNGAITGLGSAFSNTATYSILGKYFPGRQLAPYAAITVCQNVGVMVTPQIVGETMKLMGFQFTFIISASIMATSIVCGFIFFNKEDDDKVEDEKEHDECDKEKVKRRRSSSIGARINLKIKGNKQGIYQLPKICENEFEVAAAVKYHQFDKDGLAANGSITTPTLSTELSDSNSELSSELSYGSTETTSAPSSTMSPVSSCSDLSGGGYSLKKSGSVAKLMDNLAKHREEQSSNDTDLEKSAEKEKRSTLFNVVENEHGKSIAELIDEKNIKKLTIKDVFKSPAAVNFLVTAFITTGGFISYNSIIGDYCKMNLGYTDAEFVFGLTVLGISQLITGIIHMVVARFAAFSSSFMFVCAAIGSSAITFLFMSCPNVDNFYMLMAFAGFFKALYIASVFGAGMEVTGPSMAVVMFMIVTFVEGIGGIVFPYIASYLQVQVNARAGLYTAGGVQLLGALTLLPLSIKYLITPKTYSKKNDAFFEDIKTTAHVSHSAF